MSYADLPGAWTPPPTSGSGDLGRYQLGGRVYLAVAPPGVPDAAPSATVTGPGGLEVATVRLPMTDADGLRFGAAFPLGLDLPLGNYSVEYAYLVAGVPGAAGGSFELIPGGDPGGAVISLTSIDRPLARYVVAQLASGRLVQGENPRI